MLRGEGFLAIGVDLLVLCGFLLVFFVLGVVASYLNYLLLSVFV